MSKRFTFDGLLPDSPPPAVNALALVKGNERYVFLWDDEHKAEVLQAMGRMASNPELSFTWYDAAHLSQRVRATT